MNNTIIILLIKLKNASALNRNFIVTPQNTFVVSILKLMYKTGLIQGYTIADTKIKIFLRNIFNQSLTKNLKIISTPTMKTYVTYQELCKIKDNNNTVFFFSTNKGLLTLTECKKYRTGGTLLFLC
jgi:ribosomal protein S8